MASDSVECSRCGATFDSEDELVMHSIDTHTGEPVSIDAGDRTDGGAATAGSADSLDAETADRMLRLLEDRATSTDTVLVRYGQRFLLVAGLAVLTIALVLSYLHVTDVVGTTVYMFSLGTLFGLTISYLQGFIQSARR